MYLVRLPYQIQVSIAPTPFAFHRAWLAIVGWAWIETRYTCNNKRTCKRSTTTVTAHRYGASKRDSGEK